MISTTLTKERIYEIEVQKSERVTVKRVRVKQNLVLNFERVVVEFATRFLIMFCVLISFVLMAIW